MSDNVFSKEFDTRLPKIVAAEDNGSSARKANDEDATSMPSLARPKRQRLQYVIGIAITATYLLWAAYFTHWGNSLTVLKLDELATFLSGIFAPLAFLWLVLGFFQQGDELRYSADALWL